MKGNNKLCMSAGVLCDLLFDGVKSGYFRDVFVFFSFSAKINSSLTWQEPFFIIIITTIFYLLLFSASH